MRFYICNEFLFFEGFPNHIISTDFILLFYLNKSEHILIFLPITSSPHTKKEILSEAAQNRIREGDKSSDSELYFLIRYLIDRFQFGFRFN